VIAWIAFSGEGAERQVIDVFLDEGDAKACSADVENHEVKGVCFYGGPREDESPSERANRWAGNATHYVRSIRRAVQVASCSVDGGHHKQWVIDQMVRVLLGDRYEAWVASYKDGIDGPETYDWDEGIAP